MGRLRRRRVESPPGVGNRCYPPQLGQQQQQQPQQLKDVGMQDIHVCCNHELVSLQRRMGGQQET